MIGLYSVQYRVGTLCTNGINNLRCSGDLDAEVFRELPKEIKKKYDELSSEIPKDDRTIG